MQNKNTIIYLTKGRRFRIINHGIGYDPFFSERFAGLAIAALGPSNPSSSSFL